MVAVGARETSGVVVFGEDRLLADSALRHDAIFTIARAKAWHSCCFWACTHATCTEIWRRDLWLQILCRQRRLIQETRAATSASPLDVYIARIALACKSQHFPSQLIQTYTMHRCVVRSALVWSAYWWLTFVNGVWMIRILLSSICERFANDSHFFTKI